jgi:hypothetical protein
LEQLKENWSDSELSDSTGLEEQKIGMYLRLLELPEDFSKTVSKGDGTITINFLLTPEQHAIVERALNQIDAKNKSFSLIQLCQFYLEQKKDNFLKKSIESQDTEKESSSGKFF